MLTFFVWFWLNYSMDVNFVQLTTFQLTLEQMCGIEFCGLDGQLAD